MFVAKKNKKHIPRISGNTFGVCTQFMETHQRAFRATHGAQRPVSRVEKKRERGCVQKMCLFDMEKSASQARSQRFILILSNTKNNEN